MVRKNLNDYLINLENVLEFTLFLSIVFKKALSLSEAIF